MIVVTGASAGVGRATVRELAPRGAAIGLIARGDDGLRAAAREVEEFGGRAMVLPLDVADADAVEAAAERVEREFGPIDIWINNAMVTVLAPTWKLQADEVRRVTEVNYLGVVHGTLSALRRMRGRNRGTIVQVGSALAYRSIPLQAAYCASKFAIRGFTDSLRTELMHDHSNVHVTMVQLPAMNTPQFGWCRTTLPRQPQPVPPIFQPEVAARAIAVAAFSPRREIWVAWPTVKAIVGNGIAPWFADRVLARQGFDAQQTDEDLPPSRQDNLFTPVAGDHGAHGLFDKRARPRSIERSLRRWLGKLMPGLGGSQ